MNYSLIQSSITDDERILVNHCRELYERAGKMIPSFSRFLSPREQYILSSFGLIPTLSRDKLTDGDAIGFLWGGFIGSERAVYCALPSYFGYSLGDSQDGFCIESELASAASDELSGIFTVLRIDSGGFAKLSHRDYLGSITALGIDRAKLGDIITDDTGAYLVASEAAADLILTELKTVGRDGVRIKKTEFPKDFIYKRTFAEENGTIASARLDAVVSEFAHVSRERAKELINRGLVEHNYFAASDADAVISENDIVTIKRDSGVRYGKFIIDSLSMSRRSGRLVIKARKYQ